MRIDYFLSFVTFLLYSDSATSFLKYSRRWTHINMKNEYSLNKVIHSIFKPKVVDNWDKIKTFINSKQKYDYVSKLLNEMPTPSEKVKYDTMQICKVFDNAEIEHVDLLRKWDKTLTSQLGFYYAYHGKKDLADHLINVGCDINYIMIGAICGLRSQNYDDLIIQDQRNTSLIIENSFFNETSSREDHRVKIISEALFHDELNKTLVYNEVIAYTFKAICGSNEIESTQVEYFFKNCAFDAIADILAILDPDRPFASSLKKKFTEEFTSEHDPKLLYFAQIYLSSHRIAKILSGSQDNLIARYSIKSSNPFQKVLEDYWGNEEIPEQEISIQEIIFDEILGQIFARSYHNRLNNYVPNDYNLGKLGYEKALDSFSQPSIYIEENYLGYLGEEDLWNFPM